jgi:hypothetical protein
MLKLKRHTPVGIGIILVLALLIGTHIGQGTTAPAGPGNVVNTNTTANSVPVWEVNNGPKEFVMLSAIGLLTPFFRIYPDGTTATSPFRVPDGQVLVVTDQTFTLVGAFGGVIFAAIKIINRANPLIAALGPAAALNFSGGAGGATTSLSTGFVVSDAAIITPVLLIDTFEADLRTTLTGYLKPAS